MPRNDAYSMATASALRSLRRRRAGEHAHTEAQIAEMFGGEWGLSWHERRQIEAALLSQREKAGGSA